MAKAFLSDRKLKNGRRSILSTMLSCLGRLVYRPERPSKWNVPLLDADDLDQEMYSDSALKTSGVIVEPDRPQAPLEISNVTENSVTLRWLPPQDDGGGTILSYVIEAKDVLDADIRKTYCRIEASATEHVFTGLKCSHIYQFRVYAENEAGRSEGLVNKKLVKLKRICRKPGVPGKPTVEIIGNEENDSVLLFWSIDEDSDRDLYTTYIVERYDGKNNRWAQVNKNNIVSKSYKVTGLAANVKHVFRVSSENRVGVSQPSEPSEPIILDAACDTPPEVLVPIQDVFVKEGEEASFHCMFLSGLTAQVTWFKDGIRVYDGLYARIATSENNSTLVLEEVDVDDDGCEIQCEILNSIGRVHTEARLKIIAPARIHKYSSYDDGLLYDSGDDLRIKFGISGSPFPKVSWYFDGDLRNSDTKTAIDITQDTSRFSVQDVSVEDSGVYELRVSNEFGQDEAAVSVTVLGVPYAPPGTPEVTFLSDSSCEIFWEVPEKDGGSAITSYVVEYKLKPSGEWIELARAASRDRKLRFDGIKENQEYSFRIKAVNAYGISQPGRAVDVVCTCSNDSTTCSEITQRATPSETGTRNSIDVHDGDSGNEFNKFYREAKYKLEYNLHPSPDVPADKESRIESKEVLLTLENGLTEEVHNIPQDITSRLTLEDVIERFACQDNYILVYISCIVETSEILEPSFHEVVNTSDRVTIVITDSAITWTTPFTCVNSSASLEHKLLSVWEMVQSRSPHALRHIDSIDSDITSSSPSRQDIPHDGETLPYASIKPQYIMLAFDKYPFVTYHILWEEISSYVDIPLVTKRLEGIVIDPLYGCVVAEKTVFENIRPLEDRKGFCKFEVNENEVNEDEICCLGNKRLIVETRCKPALSVLPLKVEPVLNELKHVDSDVWVSDVQSYYDVVEDAISLDDMYDEIADNELWHVCEGAEESLEVTCPKLEDLFTRYENGLEWDYKSEFPPENDLNRLEDDITAQKHEYVCNDEIPSWLKQVSPNYTFITEHSENLAVLRDGSSSPSDEESLKEQSVKRLLNIADEAQRRFDVKADRIEALENILSQELMSLEKDIALVSEIQRSIGEDASAETCYKLCYTSPITAPDGTTVHADYPKTTKNLIDFSTNLSVSQACNEHEKDGYAPQFTSHLQNKVITAGNRIRLVCYISSDPDPVILWLKNGKAIPEKRRYVYGTLWDYGLCYFDIYNSNPSDSGEYSCTATNCFGTTTTQAYLRVMGEKELSPESPKFDMTPEDTVIQKGTTVTLEWHFSGTPFPKVIWYKNAEKLESSLRIDVFVSHRGLCRLVIRDVTSDDSGIYTCLLENEAGSVLSTVFVTVTC